MDTLRPNADRLVPRDIPWLPALAVLVAVVLYARLPDKFIFGTHVTAYGIAHWIVPALEVGLLVALVVVGRTETRAATPSTRYLRPMTIALIAIISAANLVSVVLLVDYLVKGGRVNGHELLVSAIDIWWTNVIVFALWFWELDGGGPLARLRDPGRARDFLFPQMTEPALAPGWRPDFVDYLYVAFTNATAFSPTDAMPLTRWAKMLMLVESSVSLLALVMVAARAVNILG
jgi:hypothetical protein